MAWTTPRTWVTGEVVTASIMNTHVRDNFLVTGPAMVTGGGSGLITSNGTNTLAWRVPAVDSVTTAQTTTSTSYTDLATSGPAVTVTCGTAALININVRMENSGAGGIGFCGVDISGASAIGPTDITAAMFESSAAADKARLGVSFFQTGLTAGSNTFTLKYKTTAGTQTFQDRRLSVVGI